MFFGQVRLMWETDVLISPHGAALQNLMFMKAGSAVIELMTAPWYEPGYQATALVCDVSYYVVPLTDVTATRDCVFPVSCLHTPLLVHRRDLSCYGIRQCNAFVDLGSFEVQFWLASQAVRIKKRLLAHDWRSPIDVDVEWHSSKNREISRQWYLKPYVTPLFPLTDKSLETPETGPYNYTAVS